MLPVSAYFVKATGKETKTGSNSTSTDISSVGIKGNSQGHMLFIIGQFWGRELRSYWVLMSLRHTLKERCTHECNLQNTPLVGGRRSRNRYNVNFAAVISDHKDQRYGTEDEMTRYCSFCQINISQWLRKTAYFSSNDCPEGSSVEQQGWVHLIRSLLGFLLPGPFVRESELWGFLSSVSIDNMYYRSLLCSV